MPAERTPPAAHATQAAPGADADAAAAAHDAAPPWRLSAAVLLALAAEIALLALLGWACG